MRDAPVIRLPAPEPAAQGEADAGRLLQILWRGKWILLLLPALAYLGVRLWLATQTEIFQASAQIQVGAREVNPLRSGGTSDATTKPRTVLKQQQQLVRSTALLKQIAESPALQGLKTFAPKRLGAQSVVGELYENLSATIDVDSDRLILTYLSPYHDEAELVLGEVVRVYIEYHKEKKRQQVTAETEILRGEWERNKHELEETTQRISDLRAANRLPAGTSRTPLEGRLDDASSALHAAHQETLHRSAAHEDLVQASADAARFRERGRYWRATRPIASLEERFDAARREREEKESEHERTRRVYGEANPRLTELAARIAELHAEEDDIVLSYAQDYLANTDVDLRQARSVEETLESEVRGLQSQLVEENRIKERIADLELERTTLRDVVARFGDRITELEVEHQTGALNLDVVEQARAPWRPAYPEVQKTLIYGVGGSLMLAFALVMLLGLSDRRLRDVEEVPGLLGASVLGVVPELEDGERLRVARTVEQDTHSLAAEAIRSVRTATSFALTGGRGLVLVASASSGEGKSACASNLAYALARAGKRTLLVDADMRRPAQHAVYGVGPAGAVGLAGLLASAAPLRTALVKDVAPNLDLLPAGDAAGKAAELCEGAVLAELLRSLRESYECIVVDSPAVLESSEARVLASLSDAVVFVVRLDASRRPAVKRAAGILRGVNARLLGCIVNGAGSRRGARAYAGGISFETPSAGGTGRRRRATDVVPGATPGSATGTPPAGEKPTSRGTDFLGLEEESESA